MKYVIACIAFFLSLATVYATTGCTSTSDCTTIIPSSNSYCNSQSICQCQAYYILNCINQASVLPVGSSTLSILPNTINYYIISNYTDQTLEYILTLTDKTQIDMLANYSINLYVDNGYNVFPNIPTATIADTGSQLKISLQSKLGTMPGTNIAQYLILAVQNKQSILAFVAFNLNFASVGNSNTLLIVAYTGGGVCLCATIILIVVVYRKKRNQANPNQRQNNEPTVNDISHFEVLMPRSTVSIQHKKDGRVCSVCLQEFQLSSIVRVTVCNHIFHTSCIDEWCTKNLICPMCRTDLSSNNILILKTRNIKEENNSSWIVNSMDQEALNDNEESEPKQAAEQPPSKLEGLAEPLLAAQNPINHDRLDEPQFEAENQRNPGRMDEPFVQAEDSNRVSLIGNDQL